MILYSVNEHRLCLMPKNLFIESKHRSLYFLFFTIRPTFQNSKITTNYFFCYSVIFLTFILSNTWAISDHQNTT